MAVLYQIYNHEPKASDCISDTTRTRILYITYETSRCIHSCSTKILKIKLNLAEKIGVKVYANQDDFVSDLQPPPRTMISIVFSSLIIHELSISYLCLEWEFALTVHHL